MAKRARVARREHERVLRGVVRNKERLWRLDVGGSIERPIVVGSTAVIELRATATKCLQCGGDYDVIEHRALVTASGSRRRVVALRCRLCGVAREMFFEIDSGPEFS